MKHVTGAARKTKPSTTPASEPEDDNRTVKDIMRGLVDRLSPDCTWDDVLYKVFVCKKIAAGMQDAKEGRLLTEEEVYRELDQ